MNIDRANKLLKKLESLEPGMFQMEHYLKGKGCNTTGCIAGWAVVVARMKKKSISPFDEARDWLGIDNKTALALFYPKSVPLCKVRQRHAIVALEAVIAGKKTEKDIWGHVK
jgi:hypothetical protein